MAGGLEWRCDIVLCPAKGPDWNRAWVVLDSDPFTPNEEGSPDQFISDENLSVCITYEAGGEVMHIVIPLIL
jgi:hypothetical protein